MIDTVLAAAASAPFQAADLRHQPIMARQEVQMRKISFVIAAAALILTASVGGWVASTTAHDRGADFQNFRGGTPAGGGLFVMPPVY